MQNAVTIVFTKFQNLRYGTSTNGCIRMYISKIKEIIIAWDPIGLIYSGAPNNEYDYEISQIANSINDKITIDALAKTIYKVFSDSFGKDTFNNDFDECLKIAIKCFNLLDE